MIYFRVNLTNPPESRLPHPVLKAKEHIKLSPSSKIHNSEKLNLKNVWRILNSRRRSDSLLSQSDVKLSLNLNKTSGVLPGLD